MKKTITNPDGTVVVIEGTPEEIAAHEKAVRDSGKIKESKKKPEVLKGDSASKLLEELLQLHRDQVYSQPIWIATCSVCHRYNCICHHINPLQIICKTLTTTSNTTLNTTSDKLDIVVNYK